MGRPAVRGSAQRDNNFNFLRLAAAVLVVFSHSFSVSRGAGYTPLGVSFGDIAVDVFFVTSGFLVTGAALSRRDALFFLKSRALRIFPGLFVALGLTVFVLGPLVTTLSPGDYLRDAQIFRFLLSNATLVATDVQALPGVFEHNPFSSVVNDPLWSLEWEMAMYWALFLFTLPYVVSSRYRMAGIEALRFVFPLIFLSALGILLFKFARDNLHNPGPLMIVDVRFRVIAMFFGGASFWLWRERISFAGRYGLALTLFLVVAVLVSPRLFVPVYYVTITWLTLILAHLNSPMLSKVNNIGDYSYGIYIYSFPVQQTVAILWAGIGAFEMFGLSILGTVPLAVLSWHVIEKRALALKNARLSRVREPSAQLASP